MRRVLLIAVACLVVSGGCASFKKAAKTMSEGVIKVAENEDRLFGNYERLLKGEPLDKVFPKAEDRAHELALVGAHRILMKQLKGLAEDVLEEIQKGNKEDKDDRGSQP